MSKYKFADEKDIINLGKDEINDKTVENLKNSILDNSDMMLGYLQEVYAINTVDKIIEDKGSYIYNEWLNLKDELFDKLNSKESFKEVIDNGLYKILDEKNLMKDYSTFKHIMIDDPKYFEFIKDKSLRLDSLNERIESRRKVSENVNDIATYSSILSFMFINNPFNFNMSDFNINTNGVLEDEEMRRLKSELFNTERMLGEAKYAVSDEYYVSIKNSALNEVTNHLDKNKMNLVILSMYPEFLVGEFNHYALNDEQKDVARFIITRSEEFNNKTDEFKNEFNKVMDGAYRKDNIERHLLTKRK